MTISKEERAELRRLLADDNGPAAEQLIAAADAAPALLEALDASDERIASLDAEVAVAGAFFAAQRESPNSEDIVALKARIAELEAATQWRPIEEAPMSESMLVGATDCPVVLRAYFSDGEWRQSGSLEPIYFTPTHFRAIPKPPIPALPEGGAK